MDFDLVTGISKNYLDIAKLTIPTWRIKPQFKNKKLIIFYSELDKKELKFFEKLWDNDVELIKWEMEEYESTRELMLSAFVLGTSQHVKSDYWVKLDCDSYFTDDSDVFTQEHFDYDMYGQSWGYTKPRKWLAKMDQWAGENGLEGGSLFEDLDVAENGYSHKRIISKICLHKTDFIKEAVKYAPKRLPIPSHDTFLWYMAERLPHRKWGASRIMNNGVGNRSRYGSIKAELDKFNVIDVAGRERSTRRYFYGYEHNLFDKVQLEITAMCNLSCPNCDRSCGQQQAPTNQHMEVKQIKRFVKKSLKMKYQWKRIDIIGGEPTLHPEIFKIFDELKKYKDQYPDTFVRITTNSKGAKVKSIIEQIPKWIKVKNTDKENNHISEDGGFTAFNDAPIDHGVEDAPVCDIPWRCGLGMTPNGFYPCGAGGGIDRVFNFDIGLRRLEQVTTDNLKKQLSVLCKYCGHSPTCHKHNTDVQENSKTWEEAYNKYKQQ
jgi:hypothetical protein